jgi:hypothetical protein
MAYIDLKNLWYKFMGNSYTLYIHICTTYIWCIDLWQIHIEYITCSKFNSPYVCCTLNAPCICFLYFTFHMWWIIYVKSTIEYVVIMWLYVFPNVFFDNYFQRCYSRFHCVTPSVTLMYPIIAQVCTTWFRLLCILYGVFKH